MKSLIAFIQLLRPLNLVIIAFTMYAMRWGVLFTLFSQFEAFNEFYVSEFHFALSVLIMVLLAGAGNLINDYFDVKVDRLNKPEKVLVGRKVKRRVVMVTHHGLNILATLITVYLAVHYHNYWIIVVPVVMAASLWFYSMTFKRQFWIGNFIVAMMVGVVPLWSGVFELTEIYRVVEAYFGGGSAIVFQPWAWLVGYAVFAILLTLIREVIKDMEDIRGDKAAGFDTLPIRLGIKGGKKYAFVLLILLGIGIISSTLLITTHIPTLNLSLFYSAILFGVIIPFIVTWYFLAIAKHRKGFYLASKWTKWTMAGGILIAALMPYWFN